MEMEGILEAATAAAKEQITAAMDSGQGLQETAEAVASAVLTEALGVHKTPALDRRGHPMNEQIIPADTVRNLLKAALMIVASIDGHTTGLERGLVDARLRGAIAAIDAVVMIG